MQCSGLMSWRTVWMEGANSKLPFAGNLPSSHCWWLVWFMVGIGRGLLAVRLIFKWDLNSLTSTAFHSFTQLCNNSSTTIPFPPRTSSSGEQTSTPRVDYQVYFTLLFLISTYQTLYLSKHGRLSPLSLSFLEIKNYCKISKLALERDHFCN